MLIETLDNGRGNSGGLDYSAGPATGCPKERPNLGNWKCDAAVQKETCQYDGNWKLKCGGDGHWEYVGKKGRN